MSQNIFDFHLQLLKLPLKDKVSLLQLVNLAGILLYLARKIIQLSLLLKLILLILQLNTLLRFLKPISLPLRPKLFQHVLQLLYPILVQLVLKLHLIHLLPCGSLPHPGQLPLQLLQYALVLAQFLLEPLPGLLPAGQLSQVIALLGEEGLGLSLEEGFQLLMLVMLQLELG